MLIHTHTAPTCLTWEKGRVTSSKAMRQRYDPFESVGICDTLWNQHPVLSVFVLVSSSISNTRKQQYPNSAVGLKVIYWSGSHASPSREDKPVWAILESIWAKWYIMPARMWSSVTAVVQNTGCRVVASYYSTSQVTNQLANTSSAETEIALQCRLKA